MLPPLLLKPLESTLHFLGHRSVLGAKDSCPRECVEDEVTGKRRREGSNKCLLGPISRLHTYCCILEDHWAWMVWALIIKHESGVAIDKDLDVPGKQNS